MSLNLTDLVLVITSFIDRNGNLYTARKEPYLYGQLPDYIRDNTVFVIPAENTEVVQTVLTQNNTIDLTPNENVTRLKVQEIVNTYKPIEVKTEEKIEPPIEVEEVTPVVQVPTKSNKKDK